MAMYKDQCENEREKITASIQRKTLKTFKTLKNIAYDHLENFNSLEAKYKEIMVGCRL